MSRNSDYSKKILKILAVKPAISVPELTETIGSPTSKETKYAITRSLKGLKEAGLVEQVSGGQNQYARLTQDGKRKAHSIKLDADNAVLNTQWDGKWRIVLLDLSEDRKSEREALRYLLKKAGFVCIKNSVWISMYPFEHLFTNIKKDLNLSTELMIIVTDTIDKDTEEAFFSLIGQK